MSSGNPWEKNRLGTVMTYKHKGNDRVDERLTKLERLVLVLSWSVILLAAATVVYGLTQ